MSIAGKPFNKSSGFTLLEVMIALLVFSIGMLGLAAIQGTALQSNNTAYMRTIAMQHAYNMSELIRSNTNQGGVITSSYNSITSTIGTAPTKNCIADNQTTSCSPTELASFEIYHWKQSLQNELPSGRGKVSKDASNVVTITIMWDENRKGVTGENCSGDITTDLKCYSIQLQE